MITIQKQRQGVSEMVRAWFLPCQHGEKWHWQWQGYQSEAVGRAEGSYPNCHECYPWIRDENGHTNFDKPSHAGQVAWSTNCLWRNGRYRRADSRNSRFVDLPTAEKESVAAIHRLTGQEVQFSPDVEVYSFNDNWTLKHYPRTASDIYIATAVYEEYSDTVRHRPSNMCLIAFNGDHAPFDVDAGAARYRTQCEKAYHEFLLEHNQRKSPRENKGWLAWLLSEYIKDGYPDEKPIKLASIIV